MNAKASTPIDAEPKAAPTSGRLFFLDLAPAAYCPQTLMAPI
jgi:hypothetical protein